MALRGLLVGDRQLKRLCRARLRLIPSVETCTFSFGGYDALRLADAVRRLDLRRADFAIVYVGGNDLCNPDFRPQDICKNIKALVLQLLGGVGIVFVTNILPRCFGADNEASRRWLNGRRLLNKKIKRTFQLMNHVVILNPEHRFLDSSKAPKRHLFADDGCHLSAGEGIREVAEIVVRALAKVYGAGILGPFSRAPARHIIFRCSLCGSKGHEYGECYEYCRL